MDCREDRFAVGNVFVRLGNGDGSCNLGGVGAEVNLVPIECGGCAVNRIPDLGHVLVLGEGVEKGALVLGKGMRRLELEEELVAVELEDLDLWFGARHAIASTFWRGATEEEGLYAIVHVRCALCDIQKGLLVPGRSGITQGDK